MAYARKAIRGVTAVFFFNMLAAVTAYALRLLLARHLGPEAYGLFYAVFTFMVFFLFFRNMGVDQALVKYIPTFLVEKKKGKVKSAVVAAFIIQTCGSLFLGLFLFLGGEWLTLTYFKNPDALAVIHILILYCLLSPLFYIPKKLLNGYQRYGLVAAYDFAKNVLLVTITGLFIYLGYSITAPAWAYVLACLFLPLIFIKPILNTGITKVPFAPIKPVAKKLITFGFPVIFATIGGKLIGYTDTLILTAYRPLSEVGTYNVVLPTAMILLFLGSLSTVLFPMVAELWEKKDMARLQKGMRLLHTYTFALTAPLIFSLFIYADLVIKILFGKEYLSGVLALQILLIGIIFYLVANINHSFISAIGEPQKVTWIIGSAAVLNVVLNIFLIPLYGIEGAAIATTASYTMALLCSTVCVTRKIQAPFPWIVWLKIGISATAFVLVVQYLKSVVALPLIWEICVSLITGTAIYILLLKLMNTLSLKELKYYAVLSWKRGPLS